MGQDDVETAGAIVDTSPPTEAPNDAVAIVAETAPKPVRTWWSVSTRGRVIWTGPAWDGVEACDIAAKAYSLNEPSRFKLTAAVIEKPRQGAKRVLGRLRS